MEHPQRAQICSLVEPILAERDMELVELKCYRQGRGWLVRCLVDALGGVTLQQCAQANRLIGSALDEAELIAESYTIEVSSPGLDRPLVSQRDFERAIGEDLRVSFQDIDGSLTTFEGMLLAVQAEAIVLKQASEKVILNLAQIRSAKKAIKL